MSAYDERPWLALYGDQPADYTLEFENALDMFRAGVAKDPSAVALQYFDGTISRQELDELSDGLAAGLLANGFAPGDRLAVYLQNVPQFVIAMVAAWKAGGVMVSINPMSRSGSSPTCSRTPVPRCCCPSRPCTSRSPGTSCRRPTCVWCSPPANSSSRPGTTSACSRGSNECGTRAPRTSPSSSPSIAGEVPPPVRFGPDDVAFLTYTSGTTGVPKGAMNTHRNVVFTAQVYRDWVRAGRGGAIFGVAPLFHITGLIGHIAVSLLAPAPLVLAYRFEPQVVLDALLEHRPTFTIGAITAFSALLNAPGFTKDHFASFTSVYSGGAPSPPPRRRRSWRRPASRCTTRTG